MNDDFNTSKALQVLWKLVRDEKAKGKYGAIKKMDKVFGFRLFNKEKIEIPLKVRKLAEEREKYRKEKNWTKSDEIRSKIKDLGYEILDDKDGWEIKKV